MSPPCPSSLPLRQAWLASGSSAAFRPGWFLLRWHPEGLVIDSIFRSHRATNAARTLNERTWELGEVAETFIEEDAASSYLEVHVTPENQRLQLRFPHGGIELLRAGAAALDSFLISNEAWASSQTWRSNDSWASRLVLPSACFSPGFLRAGSVFRATFCRYDCADEGEPVLSATAPLSEPSYHRRHEWETFRLGGADETLD